MDGEELAWLWAWVRLAWWDVHGIDAGEFKDYFNNFRQHVMERAYDTNPFESLAKLTLQSGILYSIA